jgi:hypothetical protein
MTSTGMLWLGSPPRTDSPPVGGNTDTASTDMPRNSTPATPAEAITSFRSSLRFGRMSPASPDAASTPVVAAVAMPAANSRSSQFGLVPRSIESTAASQCHSVASPSTMRTTSRPMFSAVSRMSVRTRLADVPRMFDQATHTIAATATSQDIHGSSAPPQNAVR